jgi:hypothetical protein
VVSKKLKNLASSISRSVGDAVAGERVIAQARIIGKPIVLPGTSKHRIQQVTLKNNVLCVIDREFRKRQTKMRLKK